MAGSQNDQVLDPPYDTPVACGVDFSLIAGMKPAVAQRLGGLLRTVPVTRKNIRPAYQNLLDLAELHLDATDCRPHASGLDMAWIVHGADRGGLGQPINLEHRNAQHPE